MSEWTRTDISSTLIFISSQTTEKIFELTKQSSYICNFRVILNYDHIYTQQQSGVNSVLSSNTLNSKQNPDSFDNFILDEN